MPQRVLVTGGAGFIGSHLVDRLLISGYQVLVLDNYATGTLQNLNHVRHHPYLEVIRHDVAQDLTPLGLQVEAIYHLACPASPVHYQKQPVKTWETVVMGTWQVLQLAHKLNAKVLLASTSEVYGDPQSHPQAESYWGHVNPIGPRSCYNEAKRAAETLAMDMARTTGLSVKLVRIFNTYGPRMALDDGRVVSNFIVQALTGEPLTVYGDGQQTRSFCYIRDLVEGLVAMMDTSSDMIGPVNLGNPQEQTILGLAQLIVQLTQSTSAIVQTQSSPQDDPKRRQPNITLAQSQLGWLPQTHLTEGLVATIPSFRAMLQASGALDSDRLTGSVGQLPRGFFLFDPKAIG